MLIRVFVAGLCFVGAALFSVWGSAVDYATDARESALAVDDAFVGYSLLVAAVEDRPIWFFSRGNAASDSQRKGWAIFDQTADELVMKAVEQDNEKLLLATIGTSHLVTPTLRPSVEIETRTIQSLLDNLEEDDSTFSPEMLILLSEQLTRGTLVVQNYKEATHIAELAWQRGYARAAMQLMRIYDDANDTENSYFWGLRCIGECRNSLLFSHMKSLAGKLSTDDIQRIQDAASDFSKLRVAL